MYTQYKLYVVDSFFNAWELVLRYNVWTQSCKTCSAEQCTIFKVNKGKCLQYVDQIPLSFGENWFQQTIIRLKRDSSQQVGYTNHLYNLQAVLRVFHRIQVL